MPNSPSSSRQQGAPPLRILLLDDDSFMLEILTEMLDELGQRDVSSAASGRAAVAALQRERPQLLICDLSMPDMDGIEFLRIAADAGFRGGVALLSGVDGDVRQAAGRLALAHGLNVLGVFPKPVSPAELERLLALAAALSEGQHEQHD